VPNRSPNQSLNSDPNDGWITRTSEKCTITSPSTPTSRPQVTKKIFVTQNRFSLFSDTIDASENNPEPEKMDQEPEQLENSSAPTNPPHLFLFAWLMITMFSVTTLINLRMVNPSYVKVP
jgi:hypothetical protein